jgi:hypothetical protein
MYITHPTAPINLGGQLEYYMNKFGGWDMTHNLETFRQGAILYRNARDWAKEKRDEFIEGANERAVNLFRDILFESSGYSESFISTNMATVLESDISADEFAFDHVNAILRSDKRVKKKPPEKNYRENRSDRRGRYTR